MGYKAEHQLSIFIAARVGFYRGRKHPKNRDDDDDVFATVTIVVYFLPNIRRRGGLEPPPPPLPSLRSCIPSVIFYDKRAKRHFLINRFSCLLFFKVNMANKTTTSPTSEIKGDNQNYYQFML